MARTGVLAYNKDIVSDRKMVAVIGVLFFVIATALGAYVRIPIKGSPVPITLQTFFAIMAGAVLGKRLGSFSQIGYLVLGASGLPLFQGFGSGLGYLLGPTGGYIAGFIAAAYLVGCITQSGRPTMRRSLLAFGLGSLAIHLFGVAWLAYTWNLGMGQAALIGSVPFLAGDALKTAAAGLIYSRIAPRAREIFP